MSDDTEGEAISTGSLVLDLALGTGGWPRGRIVEIFGWESSGKTTLLLEAIASAQRSGGVGAFLDADHATTDATAARLGVNFKDVIFLRSNILEEVFEKIAELVQRGKVDVIALDSIAALLPEEHQKCSRQNVPEVKSARHAHQIDFFLKALLGPLSRSPAVLLITNQVREKVGVMFGNPETTPWETMALRNYASQQVELRRIGHLKEGDEVTGSRIRAKILKNRSAAPLVTAEFDLLFATGICPESDLLTLGLETGVLKKHGNRFLLGDLLVGMGQLDAVRRLQQDAELATQLRDHILEWCHPS